MKKICSCCKSVFDGKKQIEKNFHKNKTSIFNDGYQNNCKECQRNYSSIYYNHHKEYCSERNTVRYNYKQKKYNKKVYLEKREELKRKYSIGV